MADDFWRHPWERPLHGGERKFMYLILPSGEFQIRELAVSVSIKQNAIGFEVLTGNYMKKYFSDAKITYSVDNSFGVKVFQTSKDLKREEFGDILAKLPLFAKTAA
jgi:hypothetical protein